MFTLLDEILNRKPIKYGFCRASALHIKEVSVSQLKKDPRTYEHVDPKQIGNHRNIIISNQSGRSNILSRPKRWRKTTQKILMSKKF